MPIPKTDIDALVRDKYGGNTHIDITKDLERLESGEPLAYVIGHQPFLGLSIDLASRPLIPRAETEWWTELVIQKLKQRTGKIRVLDLCSGSGAIGLSILAHIPSSEVTLVEKDPRHSASVETSVSHNTLDRARLRVYTGDLFTPIMGERFDVIVTNPPYVPSTRVLQKSVADFEPAFALFSGTDGLSLISVILQEVPKYLREGGVLYLECDSLHATQVLALAKTYGASHALIHTDLYGRERLLEAYYG